MVRTLSRRRWLQRLLLRNESGGWRARLTARVAWADPVARLLFAGSHPLAPSVEGWETRRGGSFALPRRCPVSGGRGPRASQPPSGLVFRPPPAVPSHPRWGAYLYSSRVSVACGQQLDWRGVRHTRELCGDADPRGHLLEVASWSRQKPCPVTANFDSDDYSILYSTPRGGPISSSI